MTTHNARYAIRMWAEGGVLNYKQCRLCEHFIADAITALRLLRAGQVVWVRQDAKLVSSIQRSIEGR